MGLNTSSYNQQYYRDHKRQIQQRKAAVRREKGGQKRQPSRGEPKPKAWDPNREARIAIYILRASAGRPLFDPPVRPRI